MNSMPTNAVGHDGYVRWCHEELLENRDSKRGAADAARHGRPWILGRRFRGVWRVNRLANTGGTLTWEAIERSSRDCRLCFSITTHARSRPLPTFTHG